MGFPLRHIGLLVIGLFLVGGITISTAGATGPTGATVTVDSSSPIVDPATSTDPQFMLYDGTQQTTLQALPLTLMYAQESVIIDPRLCANIIKVSEDNAGYIRWFQREQWCDIPLPDQATITYAEVIGRSPPEENMLHSFNSNSRISLYERVYGASENEKIRRQVCAAMLLRDTTLFDSTDCTNALKTDVVDYTVVPKNAQNSYQINIVTVMQAASGVDMRQFEFSFYTQGFNFIDYIKVQYTQPHQ